MEGNIRLRRVLKIPKRQELTSQRGEVNSSVVLRIPTNIVGILKTHQR